MPRFSVGYWPPEHWYIVWVPENHSSIGREPTEAEVRDAVKVLNDHYAKVIAGIKDESGKMVTLTEEALRADVIRDVLRNEAWEGRWNPLPETNIYPLAAHTAEVLAKALAERTNTASSALPEGKK